MEFDMPDSAHLPRHKLNTSKELTARLEEINHSAKTNKHMKKLKTCKTGKTAQCFKYFEEVKKREAEALKTLENYLKTDAKKNPTHNHNKDLQKISDVLKQHKQGGWI
jgi:hypothetical protein